MFTIHYPLHLGDNRDNASVSLSYPRQPNIDLRLAITYSHLINHAIPCEMWKDR